MFRLSVVVWLALIAWLNPSYSQPLIEPLDPIGRGKVIALQWSPDGRWLAIQTPLGVWLQDTKLIETFVDR